MIAYLDASAIAKLWLDEDGSDTMRELWRSDLPVSTAEIGQTELVCALAAAVRAQRLDPGQLAAGVVDGTFVRDRAVLVAADADLVAAASRLGMTHRLRTIDAIHVASALLLQELAPTLISWDGDQRRAALAEGLPVYP